ncbi:MAG: S16 family serine protease [Dehalococcoidia bacterium]|nr:S16 family serine protease [Dehalococcoidia bacterium]
MTGAQATAVATLAAVVVLLAACGGGAKPKQEGPGPPRETQAIEEPEPTTRTVETTGLTPASAFPLRVSVEPSESGELAVAFTLSEVVEAGPMWESSGWTAVVVASLLLGADPRDYRFGIEPGGEIGDGPSAGALTTVAVLAALLGDDIREDAAMTGAINPDGTIGPVGGIPNKIQAAAEQGKTLVLAPAGQRFEVDFFTGEPVDVIELGESLGVEVRPVTTIYEAYEVLTGEPLPRPAGAGSPEMPANAFSKLKAAATEWLGRYDAAVNRFLALPETLGYEQDILVADRLAADADSALGEGLAAVAYERAFSAGSIAEAALEAVTLAKAYLTGGVPALVAEVQALAAAETRLAATLERLESEPPRSASDLLALTDAYANAAVAFGLVSEANSAVQLLQEAELAQEETLALIFRIATDYSQAGFSLDAAENSLVYGLGFGQSPPPEPDVVTAIAETVRHAADANLAAIDAYIEVLAQQAGASVGETRSLLLFKDADLRTATGADASTDYLRGAITEEPQASIAVLGSSLAAWSQSAVVIAKYYSLGAELDEGFNLTGFSRERSLADMLNLADERAEELISLVEAEEPVNALYYHENARSYREGTQFDKITALSYNWRAAILAETLAYFTGRYKRGD